MISITTRVTVFITLSYVFGASGLLLTETTTSQPSTKHGLNNVTINNVTTEKPGSQHVLWRDVMNYIQVALACFGVLANVVMVVVLYKEQGIFSKILLFLLKHQTIIDAVVCFLLVVFQVPPFGWKTHVDWLDLFLCHVWHSQGLFWMFVSLSVQNLILITLERYYAVCRPLVYMRMHKRHFCYALIFVYVFSFITSVPPTLFEVRYENKSCQSKLAYDTVAMHRFFNAYSIIWYVTNYVIPVIIFIVFYAMIIRVLIKSKRLQKHGSAATVDKATRQITKMAICIILVFLVTLGFDNTMYMLGYWGHVNYAIGNPLQVAGLLITTMNSVANPFIYTFMIPSLRQSLYRTLRCKKNASNTEAPDTKDMGPDPATTSAQK